jgi:hypothetical protein
MNIDERKRMAREILDQLEHEPSEEEVKRRRRQMAWVFIVLMIANVVLWTFLRWN